MKKLVALFAVISIFSLWGCKDNSTEPDTLTEFSSSTEEAAYNVSAELSSESSGAVDQIGDAFTIAFPLSFGRVISNDKDTTFKSKVWDDVNKLWTITVDRAIPEKSSRLTFYFKRTYTIQYLNKNNQPMKYWKVGTDTAYTIKFNILNGESYFKNPIFAHRLLSLTAALTITNANKPTVTINGTMKRSGSDTITTKKVQKTHNYTLDLTFENVTGPRKNKLALQNKLSGTITGTYDAIVTTKIGDNYQENRITKNINIQLDGTGNYNLRLYGNDGDFRFKGNLGYPGITKNK